MYGDEIAALTRKLEAINDEILAMHRTLGVLLDDVADLRSVLPVAPLSRQPRRDDEKRDGPAKRRGGKVIVS